MFEGKEVEGKIGEIGQYSVDIDDTGMVEVSVGVKVDLIAELRKLAAKSSNSLDDKAVDFIAGLLNKKPEPQPEPQV
jgi:hypothetical protein